MSAPVAASLFDIEDPSDMLRTALLSDDGLYRYTLNRIWGSPNNLVTFLMLNPSKADASIDDPTIRKCIGFAKRWGHDGITVVNLFAWRATEPTDLCASTDPVGPGNANAVKHATEPPRTVVAAWGASVPRYWSARPTKVLSELRARGVSLHHLGFSKGGHPRHPLMLPYSTPLTRWTA